MRSRSRRFPARAVVPLAALLLLAAQGCSLTRHVAVGTMTPILDNAAEAARERSDLELVGEAFPANLLLVDGLIRTEPENPELLRLGSYLYFGYALGFVEDHDPARASIYYAMGRDYGLRALDRRSGFRENRQGNLEAFQRGVRELKKEDAPGLTWTAANWGRWLSLNLDSPAAIADLPRVEALITRLVELDPAYEHGLPEALAGIYDAMRPAMFGGNPARAREHFDRAMKISDRKMLLFQVFYAEYYCRQTLDEDCFRATLDEVSHAPADAPADETLLNQIARRRAESLRAREGELF